MAGDVLRPALGDVLAALTHDLHETMKEVLRGDPPWRANPARFECRVNGVALIADLSTADRGVTGCKTGVYSSRSWITTDPREALETLQTRGIVPEDDMRRRWLAWHCAEERAGKPCTCSRGSLDAVHTERPQTIPDLVAYASLGIPAIQRAEVLAREAVVRLRPWGAPQTERVVWRVGPMRGEGLPDGWPMDANETEAIGWDDESAEEEDRFQRTVVKHGGARHHVAWWQAHAEMWRGERPCPHACVADLHRMGLALDSITADAITIVAPPIGGAP